MRIKKKNINNINNNNNSKEAQHYCKTMYHNYLLSFQMPLGQINRDKNSFATTTSLRLY